MAGKGFEVRRLGGVIWALVALSPLAHAAGEAVVTQMQGEVMILALPQAEPHASVPEGQSRAKFEGQHYLSRGAKVGERIELPGCVRTLPNARVRLVYPNGDQINVGPGTFFRLEDTRSMKMDYGLVRAIISKAGPRSQLKVRTASAVMGVRGTDFVVESVGATNQTALTLLRGSVSLKPEGVEVAREVKTGETAVAEVAKPPETYKTSQIELKRALVMTEKTEKAPASEPVPEGVKQLEAQAKATTIQDIVGYAKTPEEKERLQKAAEKAVDAAALNAAVVRMQVAKAPVESPRAELVREEMKRVAPESVKPAEKNAFDKYFDGI
jgi:hypothetical protein